MALTARSKGNGDLFEPVPSGLQLALCYGVFDIGTHLEERWDTEIHKIVVVWELPQHRIQIEDRDLPRAISKSYRLSLHRKANLRADLESWRSRPFTKEQAEVAGFDLKKILGIPCQLNIIHNTSGDKTYANVASVVPAPMGTELKTENPHAYFSFEEWPEKGIPVNTPDWIKEKIQTSYEWLGKFKQSKEEDPPIMDQTPKTDITDDIPF